MSISLPRIPESRRIWWVAGAIVAGLLATVITLVFTGGAKPTLLADSGAAVRWARPLITVTANLSSAATIGGAMMLVFVLPRAHAAWAKVRELVGVASIVWTLVLAAQIVFTYAATAGRPLGSTGFADELVYYVTELGAGRARLTTLIIAAITALAAVAIAGYGTALLTLVLSVAVIIPIAVTGHAAGAENHDLAMNASFIHIISAGLWMGGLLALMFAYGLLSDGAELGARPRVSPAAKTSASGKTTASGAAKTRSSRVRPATVTDVVSRYSSIAAWAFIGVAISGIANALVRIGDLDGLFTTYGFVLIGKTVAFVILGAAGWWHRRHTIEALAERPKLFWRLAGVELLIMGAAMGMAVVLASTATPRPQEPVDFPSPTMILSKRPEPVAPTFKGWFTEFFPDLLFGCVAAAMIAVYLIWVRRLAARGDKWPVHRTAVWVTAALLFAYLNLGGPAVFGHVLFSAHMLGHMLMVLVLPIMIVLSAPITLALRALPARRDGSRGPRDWILVIVHSKWGTFFAHPIVAALNVIGSMIVFYFSPLLYLAMTTHLGHVLMVIHFILVGYLFINVLIGIDPGPSRPIYAMRLLLLFSTMAFHAFFGLAIMSMKGLLASPYYGMLGLSWGVDALADQRTGGEIAWGIGEVPSLILAVTLAVLWAKDDERIARRRDRAADRDGEADLAAYNEMLKELATDDAPRT